MLQLQSMSSINRRSPRNNHVRFNDDTEGIQSIFNKFYIPIFY